MTLDQIQKQFLDFLYLPKVAESSLRELEPLLSTDKPLPYQSGLKIYRKNFIFNFVSTLKETYPFCFEFLGEKNFNFMVKEYLLQNPSISSDMIEYGGDFSDFLRSRAETELYPFLADVARLEWAKERAFYEKSSVAITQEEIRILLDRDPNEIFLSLKSPIYLIQTDFEVHDLYQEYLTTKSLQRHTIKRRPELVVVSTNAGTPVITKVGIATWGLLQSIKSGKSLGSILTEDAESFENEINLIFRSGWIAPTSAP